jgi:DNA-directed RNA polymerase specialized sigma subunit
MPELEPQSPQITPEARFFAAITKISPNPKLIPLEHIVESRAICQTLLGYLTETQRLVVTSLNGIGVEQKTARQIAQTRGVTPSAIRQVAKGSYRKLLKIAFKQRLAEKIYTQFVELPGTLST